MAKKKIAKTKGPDDETIIAAVVAVSDRIHIGHIHVGLYPHELKPHGVLPEHITRRHIDAAIARHIETIGWYRRMVRVPVVKVAHVATPMEPPTPKYKGVPIVRIMAWMGAEGVSFDEAEMALDYLQILPDDPNELRAALVSGANGRDEDNYPELPPALVTELVNVLFP